MDRGVRAMLIDTVCQKRFLSIAAVRAESPAHGDGPWLLDPVSDVYCLKLAYGRQKGMSYSG
jgi:hypothetical protein